MDFYSLFSNFGGMLLKAINEDTKNEFYGTVTEAAAKATEAVANASAPPGNAPAADTMSLVSTFLIWGICIVAIYFFMFRQPRKEQKAKNAMRESIKIGDNVLTSAGFYGKVVDIGTDSFVIELGNNRGVRVPVRKEAIEGIGEPILTPPPKDTEN